MLFQDQVTERTPEMETNETLRRTMLQEAESEIRQLLKRVEELNEGDLRRVEQEVLTSMFALGRRVLERVIQEQMNTQEVSSRRQGRLRACPTIGKYPA